MTEVENQEFGVNIWWTIPSFSESADKAQAIVEKHGFDADEMLPAPSRKLAVSRAARSFQDRRGKNKSLADKAKDKGNKLVYGILTQVRYAEDELGYDQGTTIKLDKESGVVEATGDQANEFYSALEVYTNNITQEDIGDFLRKVVDLTFGIPKRPSGGIYFIPQRFVNIINEAQAVLEELDFGARLYVERVMNGEQERAIVWDAVESNIDNQIESTLKAVDRITVRANAVTSHDAKLEELNGLMDIYRQLLGKEAEYEELQEKLQDASSYVSSRMAELQNQASNVGTGNYTNYHIIPTVKDILAEYDKPLKASIIAEELEKRGVELKETASRNKVQWVSLQINESTRKGITKGIKKVGRSVYELVV